MEPDQLGVVPKWAAVTLVQVLDLLQGEVFERQPRPHVERRLVQVGDQEVGFRGVGDGQREPRPGAGRVCDPLVVPGAQQPEHLAAELACGELLHLVHPPHDRFADLAEQLAPHVPVEVQARSEAGIPHLIRKDIQPQLVCRQGTDRVEERLGGLQVGRVELLEVGEDDPSAGLPGLLEPAPE